LSSGTAALPQRRTGVARLLDLPMVWRIGSLVVVLGLWQLLGPLNPIILSYPTEILSSAYSLIFVENLLIPALGFTFQALAVGLVIASVGGILLGFLMGRVQVAEVVLRPYVFALYATPRIALIPLLVLWFGIDFEMRVVVVVLSALFPIAINAYQGARFIDADYDETAASFVASRYKTLTTVVIPATLPFVFAGLRIGLIRGLVGVIVAEMTASVTGTGRLLIQLGQFFQTGRLLVPSIVLGIIGILLIWLIDLLQKRVAPWSIGTIK
jgi:ABC-type nitrate/sulfonate/bicarbonate transport system permease component